VARWNAENQRFYYWRTKFGDVFLATLPHKEDDSGFDYFDPFHVIADDYIRFSDDAVSDG